MPKTHRCIFAIFVIASCALSAATAAEKTVYRCGNSYSETPCPNGSVVDAQDSRSPEQQAQAKSSLQRQSKAVEELHQTRSKIDTDLDNANASARRSAVAASRVQSTHIRSKEVVTYRTQLPHRSKEATPQRPTPKVAGTQTEIFQAPKTSPERRN